MMQRTRHPTIDTRPFAVRHFSLFIALCIGLLSILLVVHIAVGTLEFTPREVVLALLNQAEEPIHRQVVWGLRLPRALVAIVAGGLLGLAGAILQSVTRNPLAAPGLIGVTGGAILAIVIYITVISYIDTIQLPDSGLILPLLALIGGTAAGILTYVISWDQGSDPVRLVLTGVLVAGMCSAMTTLLLLGANEMDIIRILRWTIGSTSGRVWAHWHTLWPIALVALPLGLFSAGLANALQLGDGVATGLGLRLERARLLLLAAAALLTAGAVSVVGGVGFIGLIGPHIARRFVGGDTRRLFPASFIITALVLLVSDIIARTLTIGWVGMVTGLDIPSNAGLPVGTVTALFGAPFFLYLLISKKGRLS